MDKIIPVSELRSHLSEITKWVEAHRKPVFLTKNGRGRFVLLDMESYNRLISKTDAAPEETDVATNPKPPVMIRPVQGVSTDSMTTDAVAVDALRDYETTSPNTVPRPIVDEPKTPEKTPRHNVQRSFYAQPRPSEKEDRATDIGEAVISDERPAENTAPEVPVEPRTEERREIWNENPDPLSEEERLKAQLREEENRILRELGLL